MEVEVEQWEQKLKNTFTIPVELNLIHVVVYDIGLKSEICIVWINNFEKKLTYSQDSTYIGTYVPHK